MSSSPPRPSPIGDSIDVRNVMVGELSPTTYDSCIGTASTSVATGDVSVALLSEPPAPTAQRENSDEQEPPFIECDILY